MKMVTEPSAGETNFFGPLNGIDQPFRREPLSQNVITQFKHPLLVSSSKRLQVDFYTHRRVPFGNWHET
jgi:hypothetical protein